MEKPEPPSYEPRPPSRVGLEESYRQREPVETERREWDVRGAARVLAGGVDRHGNADRNRHPLRDRRQVDGYLD